MACALYRNYVLQLRREIRRLPSQAGNAACSWKKLSSGCDRTLVITA
jgi:hypothetical protein